MLTLEVYGTITANKLGRDAIKEFANFNNIDCIFNLNDDEQTCFDKVCQNFNQHNQLEIYLMILEFKYTKKPWLA